MLKSLFNAIDGEEIADWVKSGPTSRYSRRVWFLYEWLMQKKLAVPDVTNGNFFDVLDDFMEMNSIFYGQNYVRQKGFHPTWTSLQPEQIIEVIDPLLKRGYSDDVIQDILGQNYLRIFTKK